jgi:hypothetical protein
MSTKKIPIPFDENGHLIPLVVESSSWRRGTDVAAWIENTTFQGVFQFVGIAKGNYSDRMIFEDANNGEQVNMHMNDFVKAVPYMVNGVLSGNFTYARSHGKYGIRYLP